MKSRMKKSDSGSTSPVSTKTPTKASKEEEEAGESLLIPWLYQTRRSRPPLMNSPGPTMQAHHSTPVVIASVARLPCHQTLL